MLAVMELPSLGYEWEFHYRVIRVMVPIATSRLNTSFHHYWNKGIFRLPKTLIIIFFFTLNPIFKYFLTAITGVAPYERQ